MAANLVSVESSSLALHVPNFCVLTLFFLSVSMWREICLLLIKVVILLNQGSTLITSFNLNYHQKMPPSPKTATTGFKIWILWEHSSVHSTFQLLILFANNTYLYFVNSSSWTGKRAHGNHIPRNSGCCSKEDINILIQHRSMSIFGNIL